MYMHMSRAVVLYASQERRVFTLSVHSVGSGGGMRVVWVVKEYAPNCEPGPTGRSSAAPSEKSTVRRMSSPNTDWRAKSMFAADSPFLESSCNEG